MLVAPTNKTPTPRMDAYSIASQYSVRAVAAPMLVTAAGFTLQGCRIQNSIDADQRATIAITATERIKPNTNAVVRFMVRLLFHRGGAGISM